MQPDMLLHPRRRLALALVTVFGSALGCSSANENLGGAELAATSAPSGATGTVSRPFVAAPTTNLAMVSRVTTAGVTAAAARPARQIAPLSTSTATSRRPTVRWVLDAGAVSTSVEFCADSACGTSITRFTVTPSATSASPSSDLPSGVVFWRVWATAAGSRGSRPSFVWSLHVPSRTAAHDTAYGTVMDVNGDGYGDLATGAVGVFHGGPSGVSSTPTTTLTEVVAKSSFGTGFGSAGDVNGDGNGDFVVGAPGSNENGVFVPGAVHVYAGTTSGLSTTPTWSLQNPGDPAGFGFAVAGVGDVDGDGYGDVVVGVPGADNTAGRVYVLRGSSSGPQTAAAFLTSPAGAGSIFGFTLAAAGDVNGDGYADVIVGAPGLPPTHTDTAYVYYGSAAGLSSSPSASLSVAEAAGGNFAWTLAGAGDVNGDGFSDVVVGAARYGGLAGAAYVFTGSAAGVSSTPATSLHGSGEAQFGLGLASPGDIDGDGYSDLVVTAPEENAYTGTAYVFRGSAAGLGASAAWTVAGTDGQMADFGQAVARTGDLNGDGFADVVVGAPWAASNQGHTSVFAGSTSGVASSPSVIITGPTPMSGFGLPN